VFLAVLEGGVLRDSVGRVDIAPVRQAIAARARLIPALPAASLSATPRPRMAAMGRLLRISNISDHVEVVPVPHQATRRSCCSRRTAPATAHSINHVHCGECGCSRVCTKADRILSPVHHTIADGVAGVAALGALLDSVPTPIGRTAPSPMPSNRELFTDNVRRRWRELAQNAASAIVRPVTTAKRLRASWPAMRETLASALRPEPA
jgi:hypothetical protein